MKNNYAAYGLIIESDIELPELVTSEAPADLSIVFGKVPEHLETPAEKTPWYEMEAGGFLLKVDNIARFLAENGRRIIIEPHRDADENDIRAFLLGSVFAAFLQQRGYLALHGSAALIHGKAVAMLGKSAAGKTAIALALYDRGFSLLADEICSLGLVRGAATVFPGAPWLHAWQDTLERSGRKVEGLTPLRRGLSKYSFPVHEGFSAIPAELSHVFILNEHNREEIRAEPVRGGEKMKNILRQAFFMETASDRIGQFQVCVAAASSRMTGLSFKCIPGQAEKVADLMTKESGS